MEYTISQCNPNNKGLTHIKYNDPMERTWLNIYYRMVNKKFYWPYYRIFS